MWMMVWKMVVVQRRANFASPAYVIGLNGYGNLQRYISFPQSSTLSNKGTEGGLIRHL